MRSASVGRSLLLVVLLAGVCSAEEMLDRTILPIAEPKRSTSTTLSARDATSPARFSVTAPKTAPNVVIVLLDDIGFGHSSAFGGPIRMPTLDRIAPSGLL